MKKIILSFFLAVPCFSLFAQDYAQWPADKPETGFIEESQSRETRLNNLILPQEVDMQDKMRVLITGMMQNAAEKLGWTMVELSEYTNSGGLQSGGTPYTLRSPRGIDITFQFIVNKNSLQEWQNYQLDYNKKAIDNGEKNSGNIVATTESPLYKRYQDSVNYYMNLYTTYVEKHKDEGADLYTKDKHPQYYQQKETEFMNKMTAMTDEAQNNSGIQEAEDEHNLKTLQFRNNAVVQVEFHVNNFTGIAIDQTLGPVESTSVAYPLPHATLSKLYTVKENQTNESLVKWNNTLLVLLGNFLIKPNEYGYYDAGFNHNSQGDEHEPKKIKSDKVQNISINISGDKINVEKITKLIDVEKLNSTIVKQ
jgi:hypothetical protein